MTDSQWNALCVLIETKLISESHAAFTVSFLKDKLGLGGNLKEELRPFVVPDNCPYECRFAYGDHEVSFSKSR